MLLITRLPPSTDFILPRGPGFTLFELAIRFVQKPILGSLFPWAALTGILLSLAGAFWHLSQVLRAFGPIKALERKVWIQKGVLFILGLLGLGLAARFTVGLGLDLIQNVWFFPESLDILEPLATFLVLFIVAWLFLEALSNLIRALLAQGSHARKAFALAGAIILPGAVLYAWAWSHYDLGKKSVAEAAGLSQTRISKAFLILTEKEGRSGYEVHPLQTRYTPENLRALIRYVAGHRTVFTRAALRLLYEGEGMAMDAGALRLVFLLGYQAGDPMARFLLLDSLSSAAPSAGTTLLLDAVADEADYRIGPQGAARIALAYAHLGIKGKAADWSRKASEGPAALPRGLLALPDGGALKPGIIRGSVRGLKAAKVGLYVRRDLAGPAYTLSPTQLVESTTPDEKGRFEFRGLPAGDYYLVLALDSTGLEAARPRLSGHRGDIHLTSRRPRIDLPPLELRSF
jgi:hypothetical protein